MKLDAAAYHDIINLTTNVAVSPAEAEAWKKCLLITADEKVKIQKSQLTLNLLRKLQKRGLGLNSVELFYKHNSMHSFRHCPFFSIRVNLSFLRPIFHICMISYP